MFSTTGTRQPRQRHPSQQQPQSQFRPRGAGAAPKQQQQRQQKKKNDYNWKQQLFAVSGMLVGLGIWYLTPVSDHVVELLLTQVPIEADIELGRQFLTEESFRASGYNKKYHDPYWSPKIQSIGWDLVQKSSRSNALVDQYPWDFGILPDRNMVNAFALPGGVIRVTLGLLEQLKPTLSDAELAALLGHEMGHVLHRHSQARILQQHLFKTVLQAIVYQDEDPHEESFGEAIGELLLKSADWLGQQSFSRSNEYQADASSWDLLYSSGKYNPQALSSLLTKLWDYNGRQGGTTSWESTHPGTFDRIGALDEKWKELPFQERRKLSKYASQ